MMIFPLIHGVYDPATFDNLASLGIKEFSFDLRGRSSNLITLKELHCLLDRATLKKIFLTFGNDGPEVVDSFLDLLKIHPLEYKVIFRGDETPVFFRNMRIPFYWMFSLSADWKSILSLSNARGVFLPIKYQEYYKQNPDLWETVDGMNLEIYLHAENFEEALSINLKQGIRMSIDLSTEVEKGYRLVDQEKLKRMNFWRNTNENLAGQ
jgi:hypothetical protein